MLAGAVPHVHVSRGCLGGMTKLSKSPCFVCAGNVYGVVPVSGARDVSIVLMIIHQFVAYALYVTPVFFMWEKLVKTHQKALWIRLPSRLPVCKFPALAALYHLPVHCLLAPFSPLLCTCFNMLATTVCSASDINLPLLMLATLHYVQHTRERCGVPVVRYIQK